VSAIIVEDEIVHYEVLGRGRPLIFVHGWLGSWRYWIPTMQALSAEFRTYALDLWGFGDSSKRRERYSLEGQAGLLRGFMEQLGIVKAAFVGHALGAAAVVHVVHGHPDLADRAMAVSMPLTGAAIGPQFTNPALSLPALVESLLGKGPAVDSLNVEARKADLAAVEASVRGLIEKEIRGELAELRPPCLLVYGEKDPVITPPQDRWANGLTNNVHEIDLEDSRHFPMLDEASKFNRLLADFLALKSGEDLKNLELKEEWRRRVR
jgi:pimeloyl-ACP methyl ester carboxylesterase